MIKTALTAIGTITATAGTATVIDGNSLIPLGVYAGGTVSLIVASFVLGRKVQALLERLSKGDERFEVIEQDIRDIKEKCISRQCGVTQKMDGV